MHTTLSDAHPVNVPTVSLILALGLLCPEMGHQDLYGYITQVHTPFVCLGGLGQLCCPRQHVCASGIRDLPSPCELALGPQVSASDQKNRKFSQMRGESVAIET